MPKWIRVAHFNYQGGQYNPQDCSDHNGVWGVEVRAAGVHERPRAHACPKACQRM